jgi:hypothetical protein
MMQLVLDVTPSMKCERSRVRNANEDLRVDTKPPLDGTYRYQSKKICNRHQDEHLENETFVLVKTSTVIW